MDNLMSHIGIIVTVGNNSQTKIKLRPPGVAPNVLFYHITQSQDSNNMTDIPSTLGHWPKDFKPKCIASIRCGNSARPSIKERPTSEWASLFPANTVLQAILLAKSKVPRLCDPCNTEGTTVPAVGVCLVCQEAMCDVFLKVHRKQKMSKDHTIISVEELTSNTEKVMKIAEGFTCSEYQGEDIEYYCEDHNIPCCASCFLKDHKSCFKLIDLKEDLTAFLCDIMPNEIITDMKKI
ncbi:hypothetical protein CHS0354_001360 [Potamilus streckersoni]|uniref:B box-type domain-containing protein n=1 Tax=Potamilus streckersoni TaxID=2493646 RepID=A0AAE0TFK6_9BIVA|nr:hypothetical protein CHS0354_001360 [Potamilus streckersoni]